jgi:hypothetical protein
VPDNQLPSDNWCRRPGRLVANPLPAETSLLPQDRGASPVRQAQHRFLWRTVQVNQPRDRILQAATDRAARFRPLLEELAALPAAAAVVVLNERSIPSPRGGRWYEAQVIRMRKLLAAGPRRRTRKRLLECDRGRIGSML